jgi:type IV pilus assembly protein PilZ
MGGPERISRLSEITWRAMTEHLQRAPTPIELAIGYRSLNRFFADYTRNISRGGTFIPTKNPLPPGTRFLFRLRVPGGAEPMQIGGEVVEAVGAGEAAGMDVRFIWADGEELGVFQRAVERLMVESLGPVVTERLLERAGATAAEAGRP